VIKSQVEQLIERSAEEVWAYAADIVRHPEWMGVTDATLLGGNGSDVGSRGRERVILGPFKGEVALDLDPAGPTSTRARYGASIQPHGLWRLLTPLIAAEGKAGPERELRRLKANVEMPATPVASTP
jgi:hypothetical protein